MRGRQLWPPGGAIRIRVRLVACPQGKRKPLLPRPTAVLVCADLEDGVCASFTISFPAPATISANIFTEPVNEAIDSWSRVSQCKWGQCSFGGITELWGGVGVDTVTCHLELPSGAGTVAVALAVSSLWEYLG